MDVTEKGSYSEESVESILEVMRQKINRIKKFMGIGFGTIILGFIFTWIFAFVNRSSVPITILIVFMSIGSVIAVIEVILGINLFRSMSSYRKLYKQELVVKVLKEEFNNVFYDFNRGFTAEEIKEMAFVRMGNTFRSEDYLRAEYNGVNFVRSDVVIEHEKGKGDEGSNYVTYFKGRVYELEFNKNISTGLQIRSHNFENAEMPQYLKDSNKIQTENMNFNNMFKVYTVNDETAFYVLTPHMMEHIMAMSSSFNSICINIIGNRMILAVNSSLDSLEPPVKQPIDYQHEKKRILAELTEIRAIIDELELFDKTFAE